MGSRKPAISARTPELPAVTTATFFAPMYPCVVSTPTTLPFSWRNPVTSHCWMTSTPRASAARAKPHATASCLAVPPLRWYEAPSIGYRASFEMSMIGTISLTSWGVNSSLSIPFSRFACTRRETSRISWRLWPRLRTPRLLYIRFKIKVAAQAPPTA